MKWRRLSLVPYRVRLLLRAAFVFLGSATVGLALSVLQQEKQLSYKNYEGNFQKTRVQIAATLRHPTGQLALLNPQPAVSGGALHPLLLPFAALDFDDLQKVQQAVAMSGCLAQYGNNGSLCVGIGNNPWAGGFIYVAGTFNGARLVPHARGDQIVDQAHRVRVKVSLRGQSYDWIAPFEESAEPQTPASRYSGMRGRLSGFNAVDVARAKAPLVKDFRGWIWQNPRCNQQDLPDDDAACARSAFFSLRLPIGVLQDALFSGTRPVWPPADLAHINVSVTVLAPGAGAPLLDSGSGPASPPFSLTDLKSMLLPGESLQIRRLNDGVVLPQLVGPINSEDQSWHIITALIRRLPVDAYAAPLEAKEIIATPAGSYEVLLKGDVRSVNKSLSVVASRLAWFVGAMLAALGLAWLVIEVGIIRRIKVLLKRADDVGERVKAARGFSESDLADLRGEDELGVLATGLHDLLRRVREDVERGHIRAEQERDMWHAVGHEIMSPLQSLMVLHSDDQSHRYISRMQQAVRVLYGQASPSEAFQSSELQVTEIDLTGFLQNVAANASCVGIEDVVFNGPVAALTARADEYSLEDVVTHVLRNAERYRLPGTPITITLERAGAGTSATISIHNHGPQISPDMLSKIFEYGVSEQPGNRGQGLFVAKTYMAKMGGTIVAQNQADGVSFILSLQRGV